MHVLVYVAHLDIQQSSTSVLNLTQPRIPDIVSHAGRVTEASKKSQCNNILLTSANKGHKARPDANKHLFAASEALLPRREGAVQVSSNGNELVLKIKSRH